MELSNHFVRSATWEGMATDEGAVTPKLIDTMVALAEGGVGLIISGHAYIRPEGQATPRQLGIYKDELISGLQEMTAAVHRRGGKILAQLAHAGHFAPEKIINQPPLAVSDYKGLADTPRKEFTPRAIEDLILGFADAARRARSAGFDGVQIHSAHGYLLSQFLSPIFNKRKDEYGGNLANRSRIHRQVYRAIRGAVGDDYPILIKMNCRDFAENGMELNDARRCATTWDEAGFDAIELSGGLLTGGRLSPSRPRINSEDREAYFKEEAKELKKYINIPLILVGGIRSFHIAEKLVDDGVVDYISMSRPFIREPNLINRWKAGDRRKAKCRSDNLCFRPGFEEQGIYCVVEHRNAEKRRHAAEG